MEVFYSLASTTDQPSSVERFGADSPDFRFEEDWPPRLSSLVYAASDAALDNEFAHTQREMFSLAVSMRNTFKIANLVCGFVCRSESVGKYCVAFGDRCSTHLACHGPFSECDIIYM